MTHKNGGPTRRTILKTTAAAASVLTTLAVAPQQADADENFTFDPLQRYLNIVGIGDGQIVAVQADGRLLWHYNSAWKTAGNAWANGGKGRVISRGWSVYVAVMGSTDGSLYCLRGDGQLFHFRYQVSDLTTGAGSWSGPTQIGTGWHKYVEVFGFNGDFYGRHKNGSISWSHYNIHTGRWASQDVHLKGAPSSETLYADADGVFYAGNDSRWFRQIDGILQKGSGSTLHQDFGDLCLTGLFATGAGTFYATVPDLPGNEPTATLVAFRLLNYRNAGQFPEWANCALGNPVAKGWSVEPQAALQGYPITPSVRAGESAHIAVSSTFKKFDWSVLRLGGEQPTPVVPAQSGTASGGLQLLPGKDFLAQGCGWRPKVIVNTKPLRSGLYAVRLQGPHGMVRDVPFIVNPGPHQERADIAFLMPTLTHHAYNDWGGHSQYCNDLTGYQRHLNLARPSRQKPTSPTGRLEHTLYTDIMLLQWIHRQGYRVDVFDDVDLHRYPDLFSDYRIALLGSHAEYWSLTMRQGLYNYLQNGGNLIYPGGNGIYEAVTIDASSGRVSFRTSPAQASQLSAVNKRTIKPGDRELMKYLGYPESQLLGVTYRSVVRTSSPYKVVAAADHPLLAGTGLTTGSTFGERGYNHGASGWETDQVKPGQLGSATASHVIARGQNPHKNGADLIYFPTGFGGHVFSASSISFVGALALDPAQSQLFKNAFDAMLSSPSPRLDMHDTRRHRPMPRVTPPGSRGHQR